jgi:hypothetical protein
MRLLSAVALRSINAEETGEVWVPMVKLSGGGLTAPIRLAANGESVTHLGQVYQAFPFQMDLPDEEPEAQAVMRWSMDNTDLSFIEEFRKATGPITAEAFWVLASQPDTIEIGPLITELRGFEYDESTIGGTLQVAPLMEQAFSKRQFNPVNTPAIF